MIRLAVTIFLLLCLVAPAEARKRRRIKRVIHRKPPTVYVMPDIVLPLTFDEYWEIEARQRREVAVMELLRRMKWRIAVFGAMRNKTRQRQIASAGMPDV